MAIGTILLKFMYNMERFATEIYRTQCGAFSEPEVAGKLRAASENEQQHVDDLNSRIKELGRAPSRLGLLFQMVGRLAGLTTRLLGRLFILKADTWIERRAIKDYRAFLRRVDFDDKTVALIERIVADEERHVDTWEHLVAAMKKEA